MTAREIVLSPRAAARLSTAAIAVVVALHTVSQIARFAFGHDYQLGFASRLYLGAEASIPNWLSTILLLACAAALLAIGRASAVDARYWNGLGIVFVALSIDEAAALHDLASPFFNRTFVWLGGAIGGPFAALARKPNYGWEIPGLAFAAAVGMLYLRFLARLPARTRRLFVAAGIIYVSAAVGIDFVEGWYSGLHGPNDPVFVMLVTAEETLEMVGASLFLYALLAFAESSIGAPRIAFASPASNVDSPRQRVATTTTSGS